MALGLRQKATRSAAEPQQLGTGEAAPAGERAATYIDEGSTLSGQLRFAETVQIDGHVEGEIQAEKSVIVGSSGTITANVEAESVVVHGAVQGDLRVRRKLTLHKSATVTGEIHTAGIVVEEGARFKGCIVIGDADETTGAAPSGPMPQEASNFREPAPTRIDTLDDD